MNLPKQSKGYLMGLKTYRPTSPSRRFITTTTFEDITSTSSEKSLVRPLRKGGGRANNGRISVRHRGGGHKRLYRLIDFKRDKDGIPAKVLSIEYDPNRSSRIALLQYKDGEKRYILAPLGVKVGDELMSGEHSELKPGNCLPLKKIPVGTLIHNIELHQGKGGQLCRSAGTYAQILAKEGEFAILKIPSGEMRMVRIECKATIGQVGNLDHENITIGKAGGNRHRGRRPKVRGTAMNPIDHPHGGGEGRSSAGHQLTTPWGQPTKGYRTRRNKRTSRFILKRRKG